MYTMYAEYYGTGEGQTYCVLFSKGYGNKDPKSNVVDKFANLFGGFMVPFAELKEGLVFDFPGSELLVGP